MKKKVVSILAIMMAAGMLGGCGSVADKPLKDVDVDKYVTLGEYKGLEVTVDPITVDDSEIDSLVSNAYSSYITAENGGIVDRAVAVGDTANIDYVGKKDDVAFDGGTASGYNLTIGSGQFIDGFEEGLVGVMPGETVDLNLTFPENYHSEDMAGAEVVFTVTVNYIVPTELQDSVVAVMGIEGVSTVEELRQYAYDYLYSNAEANYEVNVQNAVLDGFMANCVFAEIPQDMIDEYRALAESNLTTQAEMYGMTADDLCYYYYGMDMATFLDDYSVEAVKQDLALQAVANREGLNLSDEELNETLQTMATDSGYATVEEFLGDLTAEDYREYLVCDEAFNFIIENAVVNN